MKSGFEVEDACMVYVGASIPDFRVDATPFVSEIFSQHCSLTGEKSYILYLRYSALWYCLFKIDWWLINL